MAHVLIAGQTLSGKTTLAKALARLYRQRGIKVLLYDPLNDPSFEADFRTADFEEFLSVYWASRSCMAFIDEAGEVCGRFSDDAIKTATRGRHYGHRNHYIAQRSKMIDVTIREQCSELFLFNTAKGTCKMHAEELNYPELIEAANFEAGEYFHVSRMKGIERGNIFNQS